VFLVIEIKIKIKINDKELEVHNFMEDSSELINKYSFQVNISTERERETFKKLLKKKYLKLTINSKSTEVTVKNSSESYKLDGRRRRPDYYNFSVEMEEFDKDKEIKLLYDKALKDMKLHIISTAIGMTIRDLLIEKEIINGKEYDTKNEENIKFLEKKIHEKIEEYIERRFELEKNQ